jgi:hypothetical protein
MPIKITPINRPGAGRTGTLTSTLTVKDITKILGFGPNVEDDPDKVKHSWGFAVKVGKTTKKFGVWDYKGCRWSTDGDPVVLTEIFGADYSPDSW